ncbi:hypothetical protein [Gordonia westfalica]|nr:hypothetical protein [Gordonia westfalica]CAE09125.1 hypothetical protein [Gordonia westfalica]
MQDLDWRQLMDPVTLIVAAIALGASDGVRETTKTAIADGYEAIKRRISNRFGSVSAEVEALEREPDEELRRQLLGKKLGQAGADADGELVELSRALLAAVEQDAPELPATIGVKIWRASVGGDIEVVDVAVDGGTGVLAEDVAAGGDLRISGVAARAPQGPPHPARAREQ